jgi:hypothetical protein
VEVEAALPDMDKEYDLVREGEEGGPS